MKCRKFVWLMTAAVLGAGCLMTGCNDGAESSDSGVDSRGIPLEFQQIYDSTAVEDAHAQLITDYFTAIEQRDFDTYKALIYPQYYDAMEEYLQENYEYGMETSFEKRVGMFEITEENHFRFTQIKFEAMEDDSIDEYLTSMEQIMGSGFEEKMRAGIDSNTVVQFSVNAISDDMEKETTVVDCNEMILIESDGKVYLIG